MAAVCVYFIKSTLANKESTQEVEMGKIALSGPQALAILGRYPLKWPSAISVLFDSVGAAFSATGEVVSFQCAMDDADGSRYLRGAAVAFGSPAIAVCAVGMFWGIAHRRGERRAKAYSVKICRLGNGHLIPGPSNAEPDYVSHANVHSHRTRDAARVWRLGPS